jgi:hypothetical protein
MNYKNLYRHFQGFTKAAMAQGYTEADCFELYKRAAGPGSMLAQHIAEFSKTGPKGAGGLGELLASSQKGVNTIAPEAASAAPAAGAGGGGFMDKLKGVISENPMKATAGAAGIGATGGLLGAASMMNTPPAAMAGAPHPSSLVNSAAQPQAGANLSLMQRLAQMPEWAKMLGVGVGAAGAGAGGMALANQGGGDDHKKKENDGQKPVAMPQIA